MKNLNINFDRFLEAHFTEGFFMNLANFFIGIYEENLKNLFSQIRKKDED